jgi:hydroxyethylthiazole kinase-like uncharacterized protein yjeF
MINTETANPHLLLPTMFQPALAPRDATAHKGVFGSVAIIGGETGMVGAALLAARAALMAGAGRVYAAMLSYDAPSVDLYQPEIMLRKPSALRHIAQLNCVVIGPGLGHTQTAIELLEFWLTQNLALLLDADALNLIAMHPYLAELTKARTAETVITPHPGEASRLLACTSTDIQQNRTDSALKLAQMLHVTCVLKGAGTICAHHDGTWFINSSGNPGLASAGTGDVLSGLIGSLMAQGLSGLNAAKLGVYVHGTAADNLVAQGIGPVGLTASEVAQQLRLVLNQLNNSTLV